MILLPRHFIVVEPRDLPLPHNPVNCRFYDPALWNSTLPLSVVRARWSQAAKSRWDECSYHSSDWKTVADAACWVLRTQLQRDPGAWDATASTLAEHYPGRTLVADELDAVGNLLSWDPISWTPGADSVTDGQHRACALRAAGALEVPVWGEDLR